jgi:putative endopeptidase
LKCITSVLLFLILILGCTEQKSGIENKNFDTSVKPADGFYKYVNGNWLKKTEIPTDKSNFGAFSAVADEVETNLGLIIQEAATTPENVPDSDEQKVGDFYSSFMDTVAIENLGLDPLEQDFIRINGVTSKSDLLDLIAHFSKQYIQLPFNFWVEQDLENSEQYIFYLNQSGLALPDRDYYFNEGEKFRDILKNMKGW